MTVVASLLLAIATAAAAPGPPAAPQHLKVLVLDVNSTELTASEKVTLANLEAAHLSEDTRLDVLSGEDVKQLVALSGQAAEVGVNGNCTDTCMAELAGALGAGVVVATQAGKLGDTLVVTLAVFDAAKAKSVSRKSITASSLGELPGKLGPALDALLSPLLPQQTASVSAPPPATITTTAPPPPPPAKKREALSGRMLELYDAEQMQICVDQSDRSAWWFCDAKQGYTENAFVRKYRDITGAHDIDKGEVNRAGAGSVIGPWALIGMGVVGAGLFATTMACGVGEACGQELDDVFSPGDTGATPYSPLGFVFGMVGGISMGIGGFVGGPLSFPTDADVEGTPQMHTLSEGEGRAAASRFNDALHDKIERDFNGGT